MICDELLSISDVNISIFNYNFLLTWLRARDGSGMKRRSAVGLPWRRGDQWGAAYATICRARAEQAE